MAESPGSGVADHPGGSAGLAHLITELQGHGLRVEVPLESRQGGAGPADAGMLWIDGYAATVPTSAEYVQASPYVLRAEDDGWGVYRDGERLASAEPVSSSTAQDRPWSRAWASAASRPRAASDAISSR